MEIIEAIIKILKDDAGLASLATGGIWESVAARSARPPFIVATFVSGTVNYVHNGTVAMHQGIVDVKAVTAGNSFISAEEIRDAADELLSIVNTAETYGIKMLIRAAEIRYLEWEKDVRYNHLGWSYRYLYGQLLEEG